MWYPKTTQEHQLPLPTVDLLTMISVSNRGHLVLARMMQDLLIHMNFY